MRFARPPRRRIAESVVPMINVVFLLLIFFMMSARIAPAPPFDLTLPASESDEALQEDQTLYVAADGAVAFGGAAGETAWNGLQGMPADARLSIRADAALPAPELAAILTRLATAGITSVDLALANP